jgi:AraC family ethanolamine operon transcriptional activator
MAHHRALRLAVAREDLLKAGPHDTVASVACKWGFFHLGHFSRDYAARFGEKPSATLQLSR